MSDKLGVSIVKYLCPICGKEAEDGVIMNTLLTEKNAQEVKKLHNKAIGFIDHACKECAKYKDKVVFFIGIDSNKSTADNPYRTGQIIGVRKDSDIVKHLFKYIQTLKDNSQFCFIEQEAGIKLGLWEKQ